MPAKGTKSVKVDSKLQQEYDRGRVLLDNLVRAVEAGDATAMEQCAGACREFLDTTRK